MSPHHWCMFSWLKISAVLPMLPLTKTIFVCISSWKEAFGSAIDDRRWR